MRTAAVHTRIGIAVAAVAMLVTGCGGAATEDADPGATVGDDPANSAAGSDASSAASGTSTGAGVSVEVASTDLGDVLVGPDGLTLYVFDVDPDGGSDCTDDCLANWPPLIGSEPVAGDGVGGELDVFERADDGRMQVMVNGRALYNWQGDSAPGDTTGHGVGDVWWAVTPAGEAVTDAAATTPADTATNPYDY